MRKKYEKIVDLMYHDITVIQDAFRIYPEEKDSVDPDNKIRRDNYIKNLSELKWQRMILLKLLRTKNANLF